MRNRVNLFLILFVLLLPAVAFATGKNSGQSIISADEVSTAGGAESTTIGNSNHSRGYLVVKTENETATASLVVTVFNSTGAGDFLVCTTTAITTDTTTVVLLGSEITAADGITDVCDFPLSGKVKYTFTVTGAGADFDVTAEMHWVQDGP